MDEVVNLLVLHPFIFIAIWIFIFYILILFFKDAYWSIYDPLLIQLFLTIAPGISGIVLLYLYHPNMDGSYLKATIVLLCFILFFYSFLIPLKKRNIKKHSIELLSDPIWQMGLLILSTLILSLNIILNGNFSDIEPSLRFTNVNYVTLNYLSISMALYPFVILSFSRSLITIYLSFIIIALNSILQIQVSTSKSFYLIFLMTFFYWSFSRNNDYKFYSFINNKLKIKTSKISKLILIISSLLIPGIFYLLYYEIISFNSLIIRFALSFDSIILYLLSGDINVYGPELDAGFNNIFELWLKPFIKNIFDQNYYFANISQFLTFNFTNYMAADYSTAFWQPNNNIIIDFLVLHGYFGVILSLFFGYILGKIYFYLKNLEYITMWKFPFFVIFIISPFYLFTDSQSFLTSLVLSTLAVYLYNFTYIFFVKSFQARKNVR
jgi:hypothetical protein